MSEDAPKETHKQVICIRTDLNMRKGKMIAQGAHASLKVLLDLAWPASFITLKGLSPRIAEKGIPTCADVQISGDFRCIPLTKDVYPWLDGKFTKICVAVNSEAELLSIFEKAGEAGLLRALIQDAGQTEFGGVPTYTCCAVGPGPVSKIDEITGDLKLL